MESATETQQPIVVTEGHRNQPLSEKEPSFDAVKTCRQIISNLPQKSPGKITGEYIEQLKERRNDYKTLRSFYYKERHDERISKAKLKKLKEKGLSTNTVSEDEAIIASNLYYALYQTYRMLYEADTKPHSNDPRKDLAEINLAVEANSAFTDFFVDLRERYNVSEERLDKVFNLLFNGTPLREDLRKRNEEGRIYGIKAEYKGYIYLTKTKPGWEIKTPDLALDRDHGVDLIATLDQTGEEHYYQVKGANIESVQLKNVTSDKEMEGVRNNIVLSSARKDLSERNDLISLGNIFTFVKNRRSKGEKVKAYWLQVPV